MPSLKKTSSVPKNWSPATKQKKTKEYLNKNKNTIKIAKIKQYELERVRIAKLLREVTKKLNNLKL